MSIIYTPKGKAREYAPLAANLYSGCTHGCLYCYAPAIQRKTLDQFKENAEPRRNILQQLEYDCKKHYASKKHVHLNFTHDPYDSIDKDNKITRLALKSFLRNKIPVAILTKGGDNVLRDIDLFCKFENHIRVGCTLTFDNESDSLKWEPKAALPNERIFLLEKLKSLGVPTWASFEPVIDPEQSLKLIEKTIDIVDFYKIGKLNNHKGIDSEIDWFDFAIKAIEILRKNNKQFYIKEDLRKYIPDIHLEENEKNPDAMQVKNFNHIDDIFK